MAVSVRVCSACNLDYSPRPDSRTFLGGLCDHPFCESCANRIFALGREFMCPQCNRGVRVEDLCLGPRAVSQSEFEATGTQHLMDSHCQTDQERQSSNENRYKLGLREDVIQRLLRPDGLEASQETNLSTTTSSTSASTMQHGFKAKYRDLLLGPSSNDAASSSAPCSPPAASRQRLLQCPWSPDDRERQHGVDVVQQVIGGGQSRSVNRQKANYFFFADLAVATASLTSRAAATHGTVLAAAA